MEIPRDTKPPRIEIPPSFNITTALLDDNISRGRADKIAIYFQGQSLTYRDTQELVNKAGNIFKELGIEMENRVAILLPDSPELVATFFGAMKIGAVAVALSTVMQPEEYEYLLNDCRAKVIITNDELGKKITAIKPALKYLKHLIVIGKTEGDQLSYETLMNRASPILSAAETSKDDVAFWLYTSGTTGLPKGVVHLHHDLIYPIELYYKRFLGLHENDIVFSLIRLFHAIGLDNLSAMFYLGGASVLVPQAPQPQTIYETITRYKPTVIFGISTIFASMLEVSDVSRYDLSSVRMCAAGGEALPPAVYKRFKDRFHVDILNVAGNSETNACFIATRPGRLKMGSAGELVPGHEARLVDPEGKEVAVGEVGELWIKVESNSPYYWNKHEETQRKMIGEWNRTGDLFRCDEEGYFWFEGRTEDMIRGDRVWVSPIEVEAALSEHPAVSQTAVVGADDEGVTRPKAFVVLNKGYHPTPELAEELQQFVMARLSPHQYPRWIEFINELPKTATGKIQRFKLR
jgi:benzoate-CoA ligase